MRHYKIVRNDYNKLNEGLFKDLDKNIVSVDDPDYEQKVKDQTFKDFQDSDFRQRTETNINSFLQIVFPNSTPEEGVNYDIVYKTENGVTTPVINVTNTNVIILPINWNVVFADKPTAEDYKNVNPIPFKFGKVIGSFTCSACNLKTLKNCPDEVAGDFNCSYNKLTDMDFIPVAYNFNLKQNNLDIKVIDKILEKNPDLDMKFATDTSNTMRTYYPKRDRAINVTGNPRLYRYAKSSRYKEILHFEDN